MTPEQKLDDLLAKVEPRLRARFLEIVNTAKDHLDLATLATLLEQGRVSEALAMVEDVGRSLAAETTKAFILAGDETALFLAEALEIIVSFDQTNDLAVAVMREAKLDLIAEFTRQQEEATRAALLEGIRRGLNPIEQATLFRDSIGLTASQQRMVENFRRLLESDPAEALTRELRDGRFDPTLRRGGPLTQGQIDRMVARYRENMLRFRAETIARTEALSAVNGGSYEMFRQAIADGLIQEDEIYRTWVTAGDERVRGHHASMEGQKRNGLDPFTSGLGTRLRYPGDPRAPAADRVQCRCNVVTQLRLFSTVEGTSSAEITPV